MNRFVVVVLDGFGIGATDDVREVRPADEGACTLCSLLRARPDLCLPALERLGLMNALGKESACMRFSPSAVWGRSSLMHRGADTFQGHQEIMGTLPGCPVEAPFSSVADSVAEVLGRAGHRVERRGPGGEGNLLLVDGVVTVADNILHSTGWYKEGFFPPEVYGSDTAELVRIMLEEVTQGIDGTDAKASVIGEIGAELDRITPEEERVFIAAARVQIETGLPVVTHATMGRMGAEEIELLEKHGADLSRVTIGHVDLTNDLACILGLIDRGVTVGFDTIGKKSYLDDAFRVKMLKELSRRGRCGSIVLSMDITRRSHLKSNGGPGYAYLIDDFLPRLRTTDETGEAVPEEHIELMTRINAARMFGIAS